MSEFLGKFSAGAGWFGRFGSYTGDHPVGGVLSRRAVCAVWVFLCIGLVMVSGCRTAVDYRGEADAVAGGIIEQKQIEALGRSEDFTIERPSDTLRRRLMSEQNLLYSTEAVLGVDKLAPIEHWLDPNYLMPTRAAKRIVKLEAGKPLRLTLMESLAVGAQNSFTYQSAKEAVFEAALALDLERNEFRNIFNQEVESIISSDTTGDRAEAGMSNSATTSFSRKFEDGLEFAASFAIDLANLLTMGGASSIGLSGDASISLPLLRGAGRHIVREDLTQAERNVVYKIYDYERFKRTFAVSVATKYFGVLRQMDQIENSEENYKGLVKSVRSARQKVIVGTRSEIEVDQAVQDELRAREGWVRAKQNYQTGLDELKILLGLPVDANIELDRGALEKLVDSKRSLVQETTVEGSAAEDESVAADDPVHLVEPSLENAGPFEIDQAVAMKLALENRLDLRKQQGNVYDFQRAVVIAADNLRGELTLGASTSVGSSRSVSSATSDDAKIRMDKAVSAGVLTLDLPIERTAERNAYRSSLIDLEESIRDLNTVEDQVKLDIRSGLRALLLARESLQIQAKAVTLANKRVDSTELFMEYEPIQIRDVLEAKEALLVAQNSLTAAVISYRVSELGLQRDMGLLHVNAEGLWQEFDPETIDHEQN